MGLSLLECDVLLLDERATAEEIEEIALSNHFAQTIDPLDEAGSARARPGKADAVEAISRDLGSRFSLRVAAAGPSRCSTAGVL